MLQKNNLKKFKKIKIRRQCSHKWVIRTQINRHIHIAFGKRQTSDRL